MCLDSSASTERERGPSIFHNGNSFSCISLFLFLVSILVSLASCRCWLCTGRGPSTALELRTLSLLSHFGSPTLQKRLHLDLVHWKYVQTRSFTLNPSQAHHYPLALQPSNTPRPQCLLNHLLLSLCGIPFSTLFNITYLASCKLTLIYNL